MFYFLLRLKLLVLSLRTIGFDNVFILIKDVRNILINLVLIFLYLLYILEEIDILKFSFELRFICLCIDIFCILE